MTTEFVLNRKRTRVDAHPMKRLLDVLPEECGLSRPQRKAKNVGHAHAH